MAAENSGVIWMKGSSCEHLSTSKSDRMWRRNPYQEPEFTSSFIHTNENREGMAGTSLQGLFALSD